VVAAYGLLLPTPVLTMPRLGCVNIHASLLPRWRGAAPIERAILAGDRQTGISIMQMDAGLDTGPVLQKSALAILPRETGGELRVRLGVLGAQSVLEILAKLDRGEIPTPETQSEADVSYAGKISKIEAGLNFALGASELDRKIRAFNPTPGAFAELAGAGIKIWSARPDSAARTALPPGTVRKAGGGTLEIACGPNGSETLMVEELQKAGGKRLAVAQFLAGTPISVGERFASTK
jgi:methionyl-tRNA formyltransferase